MALKKIYNNAENHEIAAYVMYAKLDDTANAFAKNTGDDEIMLYKDKDLKEHVYEEDLIGIPANKIAIIGVNPDAESFIRPTVCAKDYVEAPYYSMFGVAMYDYAKTTVIWQWLNIKHPDESDQQEGIV